MVWIRYDPDIPQQYIISPFPAIDKAGPRKSIDFSKLSRKPGY